MYIGRCKPVLSYLASTEGSERLLIMVGKVDATTAKGSYRLEEENKDIRAPLVSREQVYCWVKEGVIYDVASVIVLEWLALHHKLLRKEWVS